MSNLKRHKASFKKWGLRKNPFNFTPPDDPEKLRRIFYGREGEIDTALPALYEGRNIQIRGALGIGKTTLAKTMLYKLEEEVGDLGEEILVIYIPQVPGLSTSRDFYKAIVLAIAQILATDDPNDEVREIMDAIQGYSIQKPKKSTQGKANFWIFSLSRTEEDETSKTPTDQVDPYPILLDLLEQAERKYSRLVIAVDDLDKANPATVYEILENSLELFRSSDKRAFLLTGRAFSTVQEATIRALGLFTEILELPAISPEGLRQIAINHLNTEREQPNDTPYPFSEEVISAIADYANGIPRQLNIICEKVLREAASQGYDAIELDTFNKLWSNIKDRASYNLDPYSRRLIEAAHKLGGISEEIDFENLRELDVLTYIDLLPVLTRLEGEGILIREEDESGARYLPSRLYEDPEGSA